jgi:small-conductance mechanosensitive channel
MIRLLLLPFLFYIGAENIAAQQPKSKKTRVAIPVLLDSVEVFMALGTDSIAARAEVERVASILNELRAHAATPEKIRWHERNNTGIILLDSLEVLAVRHENRITPELSPLANALAIREQILARPAPPTTETGWGEEELLLRLLLGVVYPFSLLVILRLTRTGIRRWEREWRSAALQWLNRIAERRGLSEKDFHGRRLINFLTGVERLVIYGAAAILLSFGWFALFPQTQPLATSLLARIIGPIIDLIGGTARGILLLGYSAMVVLLAYWITRRLSQQRRMKNAPAMLNDPVIYFPLRLVIWLVALFLILFPYPGAPRLFAVGVLLIVLLAALIALRPLIEEIAAGIYLNSTHALKTGDQLTIDGKPYVVVAPGLIHLAVVCDGESHWLPYSKILKADVTIRSGAVQRA